MFVVLATSPVSIQERYRHFAGAASTQPSFGLVCLAGSAKQVGAKLRIIDAAAENIPEDEAFRDIIRLRPDVVGLSSTTCGIASAASLAARLKTANPHIITVLGGAHVTAIPQETLEEFPHFDLAIVGEGEITFLELLKALSHSQSIPHDLPGTFVRVNGAVRANPRRPLISNMDELPFPDWSSLRSFPNLFRPSPGRVKRYPCASIVLTRGCPNQCIFCDRSVFGNRYRLYSVERSVAILRELVQQYGVKEILLEDDTFIVAKSWVQEFCERIISEKLDVTWSCLGRANLVTPEILKLLRRAGCWHISFGIESGDQSILNAMGKNITLDQIEQAVRWSSEAGLMTKGFFIVGFPRETQKSLEATREFGKKLLLDDISVMQMTPFPGTALYSMASYSGNFEKDWSKMNTIETVFVPQGLTAEILDRARSRFLKEFYFRPRIWGRKILHAAIRPQVAWHMLKAFGSLLNVVLGLRKPLINTQNKPSN
jgi:anaerobic magnesium-protoporphyrin IX monomethyl ester cyclase